MLLRRYDIKTLYSDPVRRRLLIAESIVITMAREGIDITLEQSLESYDRVMAEKEIKKVVDFFRKTDIVSADLKVDL